MDSAQSTHTSKTLIKFYRTAENYGFLSNFSNHAVLINGKKWPTVEHWYQSQKFAGKDGEELIRLADSPSRAKKMGNNANGHLGPLRKDWERVKEHVMYAGLTAKFCQHRNLAQKIQATGDAHLIEHARNDTYWGDGGNGSGRNRLGFLLERVRSELQSGILKPSKKNVVFPEEKKTEGEKAEVGEAEDIPEIESSEEPEQANTKNESSCEGSNEDNENNSNNNNDNTNNNNDNTNNNNNSETVANSESIDNGNDDDNDDDIEENTNHSQADPRVISQKRAKTKLRRNVWKDDAGRSLFEMDETAPGQVSLIGADGISIPVSALPSKAKFVVKQNQFTRRNEATEAEFREDEDDYDDDVQQYIYHPRKKETLGDFINTIPEKKYQSSPAPQSETPEYLMSPSKCVEAAQTNLELYHFLESSDPTKDHVKSNLHRIRNALISFISQSTSVDDNTMNSMLSQLGLLNDALGPV